ncbi:MAG: PAS domain-containing protein, partial [Treponema sp.]|nr:PAS domain-containing protein [Treponema sp.]
MNNNSKAHEENDLRLTQLNAIVKAAKLGLWDMWIIKDDPINPVNAFTWSDEFRLLMGYSDEKDFPNLFSSWSERIHPDDFDMVMDRFEKHMLDNTGKTPYDIEYRVFKKNGECIYIRDFCDVIRDENGEAIRVAGAIEDITKRNQDITEIKESQEKLEQREKKLEALNKMAVAFLSQSDTTFETLMTNEVRFITDIMNLDKVSVWRNFEKADGLHSSMIYRWNSEFGGTTEPPPVFKDVTYAQYAPSWEKMLSDGQSINGPSRLMPEREAATLAAFGAVSAFVTPIFFSNAFWGFVLFADGHNERYFDNESAEMMRSAAFLFANAVMRAEMEREIATAEERTKLMLDSSPLGCNIWDQNLNLIACNEAVVNLLGLKNKQEYFERFYDFSPEYQPDGKRSSDEGLRLVKKAFAEGTISFEWMHQKSDGTPLPSEITLVRVNYGSGYVLAGYTRDLRHIKAMEQKVAEAHNRAKILLDKTPLCCQLWDDSFRKIDCNEEALRLFGFKDKQDFLAGHSELYPEYQPDGQLSVEKAKMYVKQAFTEGNCSFDWTYKLSYGLLLPAQVVLVKV